VVVVVLVALPSLVPPQSVKIFLEEWEVEEAFFFSEAVGVADGKSLVQLLLLILKRLIFLHGMKVEEEDSVFEVSGEEGEASFFQLEEAEVVNSCLVLLLEDDLLYLALPQMTDYG